MTAPRNKCAVSGFPAGHPDACNDCDPCLLGRFPETWCPDCGGSGWQFSDVTARRCDTCCGSGFAPSDRDGAEGGDANAAPVPQDRHARAEGIAQ